MEQSQQYLYEYQNGKRVRNIGFMKIDNQMDKSTIQIYARPLDQVKGILLQRPNGELYLGTWEEELPGMDVPMTSPSRRAQPQSLAEPQPIQSPQPPEEPQPPAESQPAPTPQSPTMQQPSVAPQSSQPPAPQPREESVEIEEYVMPSNVTYEKIKRQDLSRLPRREWRIANNSFLLHGFYNYHHLLYIEEEDKVWIGVPGIYHEKEQTAAKAFGFGEFRRVIDVDIELAEDEKNTYEDFGYWCRQIPNS